MPEFSPSVSLIRSDAGERALSLAPAVSPTAGLRSASLPPFSPAVKSTFRLIAAICVILASGVRALAAEPSVDTAATEESRLTFEKHVRPIFKAHCFLCHGEEPELAGELDLRLVRLMLAGGDSGPAVTAGQPDESVLWQRIESDEMPPGPKKLTEAEKQTIAQWIRSGLATARPEPEDPKAAQFTEEELSHWAFQPVSAIQPPAVLNRPASESESPVPHSAASELAGAIANPIDAFIAARLAAAGKSFSPAADRRTLIRRLTFDLHGLPPEPEDVRTFVEDTRPDAYERLVDRLLASPHYGVRWGRHWLDVAGYAESDGNLTKDRPRPHAWHYRDYVIQAFNNDKPYDRFLQEQLAGDELIAGQPDPNNAEHVELLAATGLLRMAPDITQTDDTLLDRNQAVADVIQVVSTAVLGLTVACAQCHDHRYDPITIEDYYRMRAVFDPVMPIHQWKKPAQRLIDMTDDATRQASAAIEAEAVALQNDINERRRAHCQTIQDREIAAAPEEFREALREAIALKPSDQTAEQKALLDRFPKVRTVQWIIGQLVEYDSKAHRAFQEEEKQVAAIRKRKPIERLLMAVQESRDQLPNSHVFFRGNPESPVQPVTPGELTVLVSARPHVTITPLDESLPRTSGRRLAYARQLTDGTHPLVARVAVNRVWMHHFGRGLVETPSDFGLNAAPPSHPELLDWLADDFVRQGWSLKRLHKQIVTSLTYQQTAMRAAESTETLASTDGSTSAAPTADPDNVLLGRMNLRRLDAESIRDAILQVSGQLNSALGGPSVPVAEDAEGKAVIGTRLLRDGLFAGIESAGSQAQRRSVYISSLRNLPLNELQTFDLPAMTPNCQQRDSSTVAPQALWFMNDASLIAASRQMAASLWTEPTAEARVRTAFLRTYAAEPAEDELAECLAFLAEQTELFRAAPPKADEPAPPMPAEAASADPAELAALASLCQMMLSSNRFLYVP